ncbi:DUF1993 domain-containing protein [Amphiplicatus metriothermophilus]|uniref:DUF1993 domain-containing protein n=1 Tax=Amphiplicatus metriothermophilus TaxID=1519374 RepID=A0A239PJ89_9PROT|nr:DUF1993 domain-containing protein [Amphiplicatus metriothermophilus]MBB5518036.1 hypothetical protein [Amphiplicatus metriothermophilus]SNT67630.1 hypothetical protein SAMN06297382_0122 [Amphiplicatus metriothermophilus]
MPLSLSDVAYASLNQMLAALDGVLDKGAAHARAKGVEEQVFLDWRLAPDMFPMKRQTQIACDIASRGLARLARVEPPSVPDTEESFEALRARVAKARDFIRALDRGAIDSQPEAEVTFPVGQETMTLKRRDYLLNFVLPNVYFHVTAAYALLRACGVPLGKADFLARPR